MDRMPSLLLLDHGSEVGSRDLQHSFGAHRVIDAGEGNEGLLVAPSGVGHHVFPSREYSNLRKRTPD